MTTTPLIVLVTGVSGSGKTAVAGQLRELGYDTVSLDGHPGLCAWTDHNGQCMARPDEPSLGWLDNHAWTWNHKVLADLITRKRGSGADVVWLAGVAANTSHLAHLFDLRVQLRIDRTTMRQRITNPQRSNDFGRTGASAQHLEQQFTADQQQLAAVCDTSIDATLPLTEIVHELLIAAGFAVLRHHTEGRGGGERRIP